MDETTERHRDLFPTGSGGEAGTLALADAVARRYRLYPQERNSLVASQMLRLRGLGERGSSLALEIVGRWSRSETSVAGELPYRLGIRPAGIRAGGETLPPAAMENNYMPPLPASSPAAHVGSGSEQGRVADGQAGGGAAGPLDASALPFSVPPSGKMGSCQPLSPSSSSTGSSSAAEPATIQRPLPAAIPPTPAGVSLFDSGPLAVVGGESQAGRGMTQRERSGIRGGTVRSATDTGVRVLEAEGVQSLMHPARPADLILAMTAGRPAASAGDHQAGDLAGGSFQDVRQALAEGAGHPLPAVTSASRSAAASHDGVASISARSFGKSRPYLLSRLTAARDSVREEAALSSAAPAFSRKERVADQHARANRTAMMPLPIHREGGSASSDRGMLQPSASIDSATVASRLSCDTDYPGTADAGRAGGSMPTQSGGDGGELPHAAGAGSPAPLAATAAAAPAPLPGNAVEGPDLERLADRVYAVIEQRLTIEKERRGL